MNQNLPVGRIYPSNNQLQFFSDFFEDPTDLMFKDFFEPSSIFSSIFNHPKLAHPVDVKETKRGIEIEIAAVGISKEDVHIDIKDGDTLRVTYSKKTDDEPVDTKDDTKYYYRGITKKAFDFEWRIPKGNLEHVDATLEKGLLSIIIPFKKEVVRSIEVK